MNQQTLLRHFLFWLIFVSYELTFLFLTSGVNASITHLAIYYCLNIGLFYFNAHVVLDYAFFKAHGAYIIAGLFILGELILYLTIKFGLDIFLNVQHEPFRQEISSIKAYLYENIYRGIYFIGLSIAYWSMLYMMRFREQNQLIETEQLKALAKNLELENKYMSVENAYLQNQISPHLLFNSLNFIYITVRLHSEEAGEGIMRLSELMRYSLVSAEDNRTVLLSQELIQVENLIKLCRMRLGHHFYFSLKKKGKPGDLRLLPLVLITLVETK
jgi:two-component system LytT family sensor kinase